MGAMDTMVAAFQDAYRTDLPRLQKILDDRFSRFADKRLRFEVFLVPFASVDEFRNAFQGAL
jgi:hypothetical protein